MLMRRVAAKAVTAPRLAAVAGARTIYTQYHASTHDFSHGKSPREVLQGEETYFHMNFVNVPLIPATDAKNGGAFIKNMSEPEHFFYSALVNDLERLGNVDWTYGFDGFWADRMASHEQTFAVLYGDKPGWRKYFLGNYSNNAEGKREAERVLNSLRSMFKWASETERHFSAIFHSRFYMQREVYDALERERLLGGVLELVENFHKTVPSEYKRKACLDLDWHMHNMKLWTSDMPNLKRSFPRAN